MSEPLIGKDELSKLIDKCLTDLDSSTDCTVSFARLSTILLSIAMADEESSNNLSPVFVLPFPIGQVGKKLTEFKKLLFLVSKFAEKELLPPDNATKLSMFDSKTKVEIRYALECLKEILTSPSINEVELASHAATINKYVYRLQEEIEFMNTLLD